MRSNILQIGMHAFWGVPSLKVLNLTFNNLSAVYDHNFRGLVNLLELHLDDNAISTLPSGVFKHLTELRILTLQRNRLVELVPRLFVKLGNLQVLKLSGNELKELAPEVFKDILVRLKKIHSLATMSHIQLYPNKRTFCPSKITGRTFIKLLGYKFQFYCGVYCFPQYIQGFIVP